MKNDIKYIQSQKKENRRGNYNKISGTGKQLNNY